MKISRSLTNALLAMLPNAVNYLYSPSKTGLTIAHCLDYDLVCSGEDHRTASNRLDRLVEVYIVSAFCSGDRDRFTKAIFASKAAKHHWAEYFAKKPVANGTLVVNISKPPVVIPKMAATTPKDMGHDVAAAAGIPDPGVCDAARLVSLTRLEA